MSERPPRKRPPKKTASLEVRVSNEDKLAFLDACERQGRPASGVIREAMAHFARTGRAAPKPERRLMPYSIATASLAALFAVQSADRLPGADRPYAQAEFDYYDLNSDGRLTLIEYRRAWGPVRALAARRSGTIAASKTGSVFGLFAAHDGGPAHLLFAEAESISQQCWHEVETAMAAVQAGQFNDFDADGDGAVTAAEWGEVRLNQARSHFESYDVNNDGVITPDDVATEHQAAADQRQKAPERRDTLMSPDSFSESTPDHIRICSPELAALAETQPRFDEAAESRAMTQDEYWAFMTEVYDADDDDRIDFTEWALSWELDAS